ncbi:C39 family peptidase [Roseibacillus persicicus]|uniref:Peptidase C39-like domain-containing protein n=1 Tax=Roseibacillus persicicus TaxID=454148 RepID=A0A918TYF8_9BACT|nr:C39 family peptidase [Roseibacillus persicicus]MDQ8189534.1 C39 family peptidase [Roseibacillus persicicus]GHC67003.1 hypothetical protein GCM10007100_38670 [Roseibacillus persicicus]
MRAFLGLFLTVSTFVQAEQESPSPKKLDELLLSPSLWEQKLTDVKGQFGAAETKEDEPIRGISPADLERLKKHGVNISKYEVVLPELDWLSSAHKGLRSERGGYSLDEKELGEIVIRGTGNGLSGVTISLYNRGDDSEIGPTKYQTELDAWKASLDRLLEVRPKSRDQRGALPITGWIWQKGNSAYLLEGSINRREKRPEFIRLRIAPLNATSDTKTTVRRDDLADRVKTEGKSTFLEGVPMVDQGSKGYCVVATIERVIRFYGRDFDQHEMARLADTSAGGGTSMEAMEKAFRSITGKANVRTIKIIEFDENQFKRDIRYYNRAAKKAEKATFDYDLDEWIISPTMFWSRVDPEIFREVKADQNGFEFFNNKIKEYIDQGVPLCWTLYLGMFKEGDLPQSHGGHMRLIIGYDEATQEIIYSDSWGEGHEKKRMRADEAFCMTTAIYAMLPTR